MYLTADSVKVDSDEGRITLEISISEVVDGWDPDRLTLDIHGIDLDAFYDQVKARIGSYLRERDEARQEHAQVLYDATAGYDLSDPKHPEFHSVHADIWDARDGK
jgi:hypothetical protein